MTSLTRVERWLQEIIASPKLGRTLRLNMTSLLALVAHTVTTSLLLGAVSGHVTTITTYKHHY